MADEIRVRDLLDPLIARQDLEPAALEAFFGAMMDGLLEETPVAAVLVALRAKGETGAEVAAAARAMRARAVPVPIADPGASIDTCGTGGDGADTVNISTAAALVAAADGVRVAKHGNRSVSSKCGSADVLEACGVRLDVDADGLARLHDEVGLAFLFAPRLHPAMRFVMPVRRTLGIRTTFNLLGPLTNPAGVRRQVIGVWGPEIQDLVAGALAELGATHALVVHSEDGLDELSVIAPTRVVEVRDGRVVGEDHVDPSALGLDPGDPGALRGGDVADNAVRLRAILSGEERSAASEAVALNAAAALVVAGRVADLAEGVERARVILRSGHGATKLEELARRSAEVASGA
jgi:anthranilate phosphoribosyltransferase